MDAISLLIDDHREIQAVLKQIRETDERETRERSDLFEKARRLLTVHEVIEEEIFYPTLEQHPKAKDMVLEGFEEHDVVNHIMGELEGMPYDDEHWGPTAKVMTENVEHHIGDEEHEMFPKARQVFDERELQELGKAMAERKAEALKQETAGDLR